MYRLFIALLLPLVPQWRISPESAAPWGLFLSWNGPLKRAWPRIFFPLFLFCPLQALAADGPAPNPAGSFTIVKTYPHDAAAFTQGLCFLDGLLYESTGLYGQSTLRRGFLSGADQLVRSLPASLFGEGLTIWQDRIIQLTWKAGIALVWEKENLRPLGTVRYPTQGWGLTHNDRWLIMSDGSSFLYFLEPETFSLDHRIEVTYQGRPVGRLNELEVIRGEIWANVWKDNRIARIDPLTGEVGSWLDMSALVALAGPGGRDDVLNGIAYDAETDRIFVTGKRWDRLFEIKLLPAMIK